MQLWHQLWNDEDGVILSSEIALLGSVMVIGLVAGVTTFRDAVNSELGDVAAALGAMDQSYAYGGVCGHHAFTAGSAFYDRADCPDYPVMPRYHTCADAFGVVPVVVAEPIAPPRAVAPTPAPAKPKADKTKTDKPKTDKPQAKPDAKQATEKSAAVEPVMVEPVVVAAVPAAPTYLPPMAYDVPEGAFHGPLIRFTPPPAPVHPAPAFSGAELRFNQVNDEGLKGIGGLSNVKVLCIQGSEVTDAGIKYLKKLEQLECLRLLDTQIGDEGLAQLAGLKQLKELHILGGQVTDEGLLVLKDLKGLRVLVVRCTRISDAGLGALRQALPNLYVSR